MKSFFLNFVSIQFFNRDFFFLEMILKDGSRVCSMLSVCFFSQVYPKGDKGFDSAYSAHNFDWCTPACIAELTPVTSQEINYENRPFLANILSV